MQFRILKNCTHFSSSSQVKDSIVEGGKNHWVFISSLCIWNVSFGVFFVKHSQRTLGIKDEHAFDVIFICDLTPKSETVQILDHGWIQKIL